MDNLLVCLQILGLKDVGDCIFRVQLDKSDKAKERKEALAKEYEPLLKWMKEDGLKDLIERAEISERLATTPAALVANSYGWSGNYERIMRAQAYQKAEDTSQNYYMSQKKIFEINPRHPVIKELKRKVETQKDDPTTKELALVLFDTATLRSGFALRETVPFAERIEKILRSSLNIPQDEKVEEEEEPVEQDEIVKEEPKAEKKTDEEKEADADESDKPKGEKIPFKVIDSGSGEPPKDEL